MYIYTCTYILSLCNSFVVSTEYLGVCIMYPPLYVFLCGKFTVEKLICGNWSYSCKIIGGHSSYAIFDVHDKYKTSWYVVHGNKKTFTVWLIKTLYGDDYVTHWLLNTIWWWLCDPLTVKHYMLMTMWPTDC